MSSGELLIKYAALRNQTQLMLEAARQSDWDRLIELECGRTSINAELQAQEKKCTWPETDKIKKSELIRDILNYDEATRLLVEPRRQELQTIFGSLYTEKKLFKAYDAV